LQLVVCWFVRSFWFSFLVIDDSDRDQAAMRHRSERHWRSATAV